MSVIVNKLPVPILVTGFGPFPGAPRNPTGLLVRRLARLRRPALAGYKCIAHILPTSYAGVDAQLPALIAKYRPRIILMFGLAARSRDIRIELKARNRISRVFPDSDRRIPPFGRLGSHPAIRLGRAPFAQLATAVRAAGLAVRVSHDAGGYVCNYGYWRALERATSANGTQIVACVHVPKVRSARHAIRSAPTFNQLLRAAQAIMLAAVSASKPRGLPGAFACREK